MRTGCHRSATIAVLLASATVVLWPAAAGADQARIEERATQRLQMVKACKFKTVWSDRGSGADQDLSVYRAKPAPGYFTVGGFAIDSHETKRVRCIIALRPDAANVDGGRRLLAPPSGWEMIWDDKGAGAEQDGSFWRATAPDGFVCLGHVAQSGYAAPRLPNYRCVNACMVQRVEAGQVIWTDRGSGADRDFSLYRLPNIGSFVGHLGYAPSVPAADLKPDMACPPTAAELALAGGILAAEAKQASAARKAMAKAKATETRKPADPLVKSVQTELNRLGYATGTPDGRIGPKTRKAIAAFQRRHGLAGDGRATAALHERLMAATSAAVKTAAPPPAPPAALPKPALPVTTAKKVKKAPPAPSPPASDGDAPMKVRQPPPGLGDLAASLMRDIEAAPTVRSSPAPAVPLPPPAPAVPASQ